MNGVVRKDEKVSANCREFVRRALHEVGDAGPIATLQEIRVRG